ncbi:MAG: MFS transporter [Leptospirales bacterium]
MNIGGFSFTKALPILSSLFVNGLAGGFVWPYLPILLSERGLAPNRIGIVLGTASLLILVFRIPLGKLLDRIQLPGRWVRLAILLPFPITVYLTINTRNPFWLVGAVFLLNLARLPFLPMGLSALKRLSEQEKKPFSPLIFVGTHHLFLGILGMLAGGMIGMSGLHKTLDLVILLVLFGSLPLIWQTDRFLSRRTPKPQPGVWKLGRTETLVLSSFFFLHLVNAPLLPFTELYMKLQTLHSDWIPWVAGIAELSMVITAIVLSRVRMTMGSSGIMIVASGILALRMFLYAMTPSAVGVLWISMLDGITSGIFWMGGIGWVALRTQGRGTFNQLSGLLDIVVITGGAAGTLVFGWAVSRWGFPGASGRLAGLNLLSPLLLILAGRKAWNPH